MEQSVHRPLSQSVFWLDRRVNSAIRERGLRRSAVRHTSHVTYIFGRSSRIYTCPDLMGFLRRDTGKERVDEQVCRSTLDQV